MDKLKDFIDKNRQEFDDIALPEGHTERFKKKLGRRSQTLGKRWLAGLVAAASLTGLLFVFHPQIQKKQVEEVCELSIEIRELRLYYNMQLAATVGKMEELYKQSQSPGNLELLKQTQDVLAANLDFEKRILPSLPCREEALFVINQHYDASLEGMNILLDRMRKKTRNRSITH